MTSPRTYSGRLSASTARGRNYATFRSHLNSPVKFDGRLTGDGWLFPGHDHGHLSARYVNKIGSAALPKGRTLHNPRHRCGTTTYRLTKDILAVKALLGHEKVSTTQRYVLPEARAVRQAIESLPEER